MTYWCQLFSWLFHPPRRKPGINRTPLLFPRESRAVVAPFNLEFFEHFLTSISYPLFSLWPQIEPPAACDSLDYENCHFSAAGERKEDGELKIYVYKWAHRPLAN